LGKDGRSIELISAHLCLTWIPRWFDTRYFKKHKKFQCNLAEGVGSQLTSKPLQSVSNFGIAVVFLHIILRIRTRTGERNSVFAELDRAGWRHPSAKAGWRHATATVEQLMQQIMHYDAEFRREDAAGGAIASDARH
jgi:hypothetical protein